MASAYHLSRKLQKEALNAMREVRLPQIAMIGGNAGIGEVFFVNSSTGSDSNAGTVDSPFATITYALTKCTDRNDDTILVTRDPSGEAAYPVSINKRDIHILAWDAPHRFGVDKIYFASGGSAACFEVAAQNVEISGFDFVADASYPAINFANASYWNCAIHDCVFGRRGALQDGIYFGGGARDAAYATVYDNFFASGCARDGIRLDGASTYGWMGLPGHGNVFNGVVSVCINVNCNTVMSGIIDNKMALTASFSEGDAITNKGTDHIIDGNIAMYRVETTWTNNPYLESANAHWGHNERSDEGVNLPA